MQLPVTPVQDRQALTHRWVKCRCNNSYSNITIKAKHPGFLLSRSTRLIKQVRQVVPHSIQVPVLELDQVIRQSART